MVMEIRYLWGNNRREGRFARPNFSMVIHRMLATLFRNKHENVRSLPPTFPSHRFWRNTGETARDSLAKGTRGSEIVGDIEHTKPEAATTFREETPSTNYVRSEPTMFVYLRTWY